jgi:hypothetical protein
MRRLKQKREWKGVRGGVDGHAPNKQIDQLILDTSRLHNSFFLKKVENASKS